MTKATIFFDMSSGGKEKLPWTLIIIEADKPKAIEVFELKWHRNPHNVTCNCCGSDYSISEYKSLDAAKKQYAAYHHVRKIITAKEI